MKLHKENGKMEYGLVLEVPLKEVTFTEDKANNRFRAHLSLLALFKDQKGEIVERFSRDLPLYAPADKVEALRRGNYIQTYHVNLAPGRYTLDSAVMDREAMKASARRTAIMVQAPAAGVGISSLALIRRAQAQTGAGAEPQ